MNDLLTFDFRTSPVRVVMLDDSPWWIAADVAKILGYRNASNMVRNLDDDEADTHNVSTSSQRRAMLIISESGLYNAIFRSRREEAKAFRRWVTGEVLPTLRRTGQYVLATALPGEEASAARINAAVAAVREARRLFGAGIARAVWRDLGLPLPDVAMDMLPDGLEQAVLLWVSAQSRFTTVEVGHGIGMGEVDNTLKMRIAEVLHRNGWQQKRMRRGKTTIYGWYRAE